MELQCLVDTTNFIKTKNHFNIFLSIFIFLVRCDLYFLVQIYFKITSYEIIKCNLFGI